jgi:hypothetical protein
MFMWGIIILIFGFFALLAPMFGMPLHFLSSFGSHRNEACIAIAVIGGVMAFMSMRRNE